MSDETTMNVVGGSQVSTKKITVGDKEITLETGRLAKQASGSVVVRSGDTMVLVTAVVSKSERNVDFFPLTVDIEEGMYAAGKIPGGFMKKEGRPSDDAILNARLIDRPIRPMWPEGFNKETHIVATVLSVDGVNPYDTLAMLGASAALSISKAPFQGPLGTVRVGKVEGSWVVNPTEADREVSPIDIIVSGSAEAISMVEAGCLEVSEEEVVAGLEVAHEAIKKQVAAIEEWVREVGVSKMEFAPRTADPLLVDKIKASFAEEILTAVSKLEKQDIRRRIAVDKVRPDGRAEDEIRSISVDTGIAPRTHGSGLFTRGQTQVLSLLTLGAGRDEQRVDGISGEASKRFMHHYKFPPFCVGETGFMRGPGRREIGHGALAERALRPIIPDHEDFPYTMRLVSETLESNGSSSMASVCASALALMDAGVPVKQPVAGIAMGLIKEMDDYIVLTDIAGVEDHLGDMDFKVAGTSDGITALQMDIKIKGVSFTILRDALARANRARMFILDKMAGALSEPRSELSKYAPRIGTVTIDPEKIGAVIGKGGETIRGLEAEHECTIEVDDEGIVKVFAEDGVQGEACLEKIRSLTKDIEAGEIIVGRVASTTNFGAFVNLKPGLDGLVHISKLADHRVDKVEDVVNRGDLVKVEVLDVTVQGGKEKVSLKLLEKDLTPGE